MLREISTKIEVEYITCKLLEGKTEMEEMKSIQQINGKREKKPHKT